MPPPFPIELWTLIVKHAIVRPWNHSQFNPLVGDFDCVEGFALASAAFEEVVRSFKDEVRVVTRPVFLQISDNVAQRLRHLEIMDSAVPTGNLFMSHSFSRTLFFPKISGFSQLSTLSLSPAEDPHIFLGLLQNLPIARTLQSLDIRGSLRIKSSLGDPSIGLFGPSTVRFPNLLQLRFTEVPLDRPGTIGEDFASGMALFLSGSQNLKLLSFHAAFDDEVALVGQLSIHRSSIEHFHPSEGHGRDMVDCPFCTESYNHAEVVRRENVATRVLAEKLPNLMEVRWAHMWIKTREEEDGQRRTTIIRDGDNIVLSRDDGQGG